MPQSLQILILAMGHEPDSKVITTSLTASPLLKSWFPEGPGSLFLSFVSVTSSNLSRVVGPTGMAWILVQVGRTRVCRHDTLHRELESPKLPTLSSGRHEEVPDARE